MGWDLGVFAQQMPRYEPGCLKPCNIIGLSLKDLFSDLPPRAPDPRWAGWHFVVWKGVKGGLVGVGQGWGGGRKFTTPDLEKPGDLSEIKKLSYPTGAVFDHVKTSADWVFGSLKETQPLQSVFTALAV